MAFEEFTSINYFTVSFLLLSGTVNVGFVFSSVTDCSQLGGRQHNNFCYYTALTRDVLDWKQAEEQCNKNDGNLVSISSVDEETVIVDLISERSREYWIGLHRNIFGVEKWSDESRVEFLREEEDDDRPDGTESCFSLNTNYTVDIPEKVRWYAKDCEDKLPYICKKKINKTNVDDTSTTAMPPPGFCPPEWSMYGNKCFRVFNEKKNWNSALDTCVNFEGILATVHSEDIQAFLIALMGETGQPIPIWIGLKMVPINENYLWNDGSKLNFTNWYPKRPKTAPGSGCENERCVEMSDAPLRAGRWIDSCCSEKRGFVCEIFPTENASSEFTTESPRCRENFQQYRNACYHLQNVYNMTWKEAERMCKTYNGHLTSINDLYEQAFLHSYLLNNNFTEIWIGFSDTESNKTGKFTWTDGWPNYLTNWAANEPQNNITERCVALTTHMEWKVDDCQKSKPFICKFMQETPPEIHWTDGDCPVVHNQTFQWIDTGLQYCYIIEHKREQVTWGVAKRKCQELGGNLSSFHSQNELDLLQPHIQDSDIHLWIGMAKNDHGSYEWIDGSPNDFDKWDIGEPSDHENEKCIELYSHNMKFNNAKCTSTRGYLCSTAKQIGNYSTTTDSSFTNSISTLTSIISTRVSSETAVSTEHTHSSTTVTATVTNSITTDAVNKTEEKNTGSPGLSDTGLAGIIVACSLFLLGLSVTGLFVYRKHMLNKSDNDTIQMLDPISS